MRHCHHRPTRPHRPTTAATRLARAAAACALFAVVAGCAPDAWKNTQATGFNGWLDTDSPQPASR